MLEFRLHLHGVQGRTQQYTMCHLRFIVQDMGMVTQMQCGLSVSGNHMLQRRHVGANQAYARNKDLFDRSTALISEELTDVACKFTR